MRYFHVILVVIALAAFNVVVTGSATPQPSAYGYVLFAAAVLGMALPALVTGVIVGAVSALPTPRRFHFGGFAIGALSVALMIVLGGLGV
jgi:hypothetical protein